MSLKRAYNSGVKSALDRFNVKLALPLGSNALGASYGVAPSGEEMSHGTARHQYPLLNRGSSDPTAALPQGQFNTDWLWKNQDLSHMAPDNVSGFGTENIG